MLRELSAGSTDLDATPRNKGEAGEIEREVPWHPVRGVGDPRVCVKLQLDHVVEGVGAK